MPKKDTRINKISKEVKKLLSDMEIFDREEEFFNILTGRVNNLTDTRQQSKVKHKVSDIIAIVFFSLISGIDEWDEMEEFAIENKEMFSRYLELSNGIPSHDTIQRVFSILKPEELQNALVETINDLIVKATEDGQMLFYSNEELGIKIEDVVAIDGKETRNTGKGNGKDEQERRNLNHLNVQSTEFGITLSTTRISEKSNEIPEAQRVLKGLDLKGCIVTADALNTQKKTAEAIVKDAHADYCLALKKNRKCLYQEIEDYFGDEKIRKEIKEKSHSNYLEEIERFGTKELKREYLISDDIAWFENKNDWISLKCFAQERKTTIDKADKSKQPVVEDRYFICSFPPDATLFSLACRRHWHSENLLHWILDVTFREDYLRTKDKKALNNLALVRRFVLSILKILKSHYNLSYNKIRRKIGRRFEQEIPVVFTALKALYEKKVMA